MSVAQYIKLHAKEFARLGESRQTPLVSAEGSVVGDRVSSGSHPCPALEPTLRLSSAPC